jgi:hypothetical protein
VTRSSSLSGGSRTFFSSCGARGVCDYEIALLFGLWNFPLFIDAEASELIAGIVSTGLIIFAALFFILWALLVYGYEDFDSCFTSYFGGLMGSTRLTFHEVGSVQVGKSF